MSVLNQLGITVGLGNKTGQIFESLFPDFLSIKYNTPSEYISHCWNIYKESGNLSNNQNGKIFEYILATLFIREKMLPVYISAKVAFVPNVIYDLMFYTDERGPICISAKTSLRERYKQADLEAIALKYVHRKALSYLITLEPSEALSVKAKIKSGDVIGLDNVIVATSDEFNDLIKSLKEYKFSEPPTVKVIKSNQVITLDKAKKVLNF
ncbi:hypothetical protein E0W68_12975 [Flavobacterium salilacus subsp. salilacus]|uniref:hypothetical protein n=1 Tax=Flavobacterium TaxID=237 RepID=UPI001074B353|nr:MULTISPECIES: hypothetical protein [Flavobacterium]KAF2515446.1 hypothetical protein E0W68_12975 [Flavobacterium salilacus subsp. salilacus]MBE1615841.1 hypothetical protein [Flavobacterium sp. SaA2.13]